MAEEANSLPFTQLRAGDEAAIEQVWNEYFQKMVTKARSRLAERGRRVADEEDVALSAMNSFCNGLRAGQFQDIQNRDSLWRLLVTLTARKANKQTRRAMTLKRGGGGVRGESVFMTPDAPEDLGGIGQVLGREPTPEFTAEVAENCNRLLDGLDDDLLRTIALLKLEGHTNEEIAKRCNVVPRTIERKLTVIRVKWSDDEFQVNSAD